MELTINELVRATNANPNDAMKYLAPLNDAMREYKIDTPRRAAAFLATISIESQKLSKVEEDLYYKSAERLADLYRRAFRTPKDAEPYTRNPTALSDLLYQGYHGRGLIQITWRDNYHQLSVGLGIDIESHPEMLLEPEWAALSAAWFWNDRGCNELADQGDMTEITRRVNGPRKLHLDERTKLARSTLEWLA